MGRTLHGQLMLIVGLVAVALVFIFALQVTTPIPTSERRDGHIGTAKNVRRKLVAAYGGGDGNDDENVNVTSQAKTYLCNKNRRKLKREPRSWMEPERQRLLYLTSLLNIPHKVALMPGQSVGTGNYLLEVQLGTPPTEHLWVLDTGSDLAWTQCLPCTSCFAQSNPAFNPNASSTFLPINCTSNDCAKTLGRDFTAPCTAATFCHYVIRYADGSVTTGDFARETLSFGGILASRNYPIGCGHTNTGISFSGMDGLIGFSMGALAFPRQTNTTTFSYCMSSPFASVDNGYIEFPATPSLNQSCIPFDRSLGGSFYVIRIANVSVNGRRFGPSSLAIVDSGTIITRLAISLYNPVREAFRNATSSLRSVPDPSGEDFFDMCFSVPLNTTLNLPFFTFVFSNGASFTPAPSSLLFPVTDIVRCFAFLPMEATYSILGNYQQQGYQFLFDLGNNRLCIGNNTNC